MWSKVRDCPRSLGLYLCLHESYDSQYTVFAASGPSVSTWSRFVDAPKPAFDLN